MRPAFAAATILAAFLAVTLVAARHDARYSTALAARELSAGRLPAHFLATGPDRVDLSKALQRCAPGIENDTLLKLAAIEISAANASARDAESVDASFERLALEHPGVPFVQYRCAVRFLDRLQASSVSGANFLDPAPARLPQPVPADCALKARLYLLEAARLDPDNSVYYYETAYSYLLAGDVRNAILWFLEAGRASRFSPGDDELLSTFERITEVAEVPTLERVLVLYPASQAKHGSVGLGTRMEALVSGLVAEAARRKIYDEDGYSRLMLGVEDLSAKLLQNGKLLSHAQASLVADGLMWRQAARDAARERDSALMAEARKRLVEASYRYVLIGLLRARSGLLPQQSIVELDTPIEMRLDFSSMMQTAAGVSLMLTIVLLTGAAAAGLLAVRLHVLRQPALALATLAVFALLAYGGCFLSLAGERARVTDEVARRVNLALTVPRYLRECGQPSGPADYNVAATREMLDCFEYTLQAARVLGHVGTRESFDALIDALDSPRVATPWNVAVALRESTGLDFGYRVNGSKAANYEAIKAWRQWWRENRDRFPDKPPVRQFAEGKKGAGSPGQVRTP